VPIVAVVRECALEPATMLDLPCRRSCRRIERPVFQPLKHRRISLVRDRNDLRDYGSMNTRPAFRQQCTGAEHLGVGLNCKPEQAAVDAVAGPASAALFDDEVNGRVPIMLG
jgi:hypothetical protein